MKQYFIGRMIALIPTLFGISVIAFFLGVLSPGNPAEIALSQGGYEPTPEQIVEMEHRLGLDRPYVVQYLDWVGNILKGDFGTSYINGRPISEELLRRLPKTLNLAAYAVVLTCFFGIVSGIAAAWFKDRLPDRLLMFLLNAILSLPAFWIGLILILVFSERLKLLPTSGYGGFSYMILPSITLSCVAAATIGRMTRAALMAEFGKPYYITAVTRGIGKKRLVIDNALPNALAPILPMIGNFLGGVLGGTVVVESIFAIPGIGSYAIEAVGTKDFPALQGYVLVTGTIFVGISLLVDIIGVWISPEVRFGE